MMSILVLIAAWYSKLVRSYASFCEAFNGKVCLNYTRLCSWRVLALLITWRLMFITWLTCFMCHSFPGMLPNRSFFATHKLLFVVVFLVNILCPRGRTKSNLFGSYLFTNFWGQTLRPWFSKFLILGQGRDLLRRGILHANCLPLNHIWVRRIHLDTQQPS